MEATLFDGTSETPCSAVTLSNDQAEPGMRWVDVELASVTDGDADGILSSLGLDADEVRHELTVSVGVRFALTPNSIEGAAWSDESDGSSATPMYFHWSAERLVTVRIGGAVAVRGIKAQLRERSTILHEDPSRLVGLVLRLLTITVQRGLMDLAVKIGSLDLEVIASSVPNPKQATRLTALRQVVQPLGLRYPLYRVNVSASLMDASSVAGLSSGGVDELRQFSTAIDGTWQTLQGVVEALRNTAQDLQGQINTWQGNRINALTVVTMIFLPISFLTGYFGMNFSWLDDQLESFGAWLVFGVLLPIASVVVALVLLSRRGFRLGGPPVWRNLRVGAFRSRHNPSRSR